MATIELPCTSDGCVYKTPVLPYEFAFQQMNSHRADAHNSNAAAPAPIAPNHSLPKPEKVGRPTFALDQSSEKWEYFKTRWETYKTATGITGNNIQIQLMETCSESLRFAMFQYDANIIAKPEDSILASMKRLSVKEENVMVSRVNMHNIRQESDEPVRNFSARLKGQAELCKFSVKCITCNTDSRYTDHMVRDALIRGLYDQDIQRDVLGLENQEMDLEQLLKLLEAKETGRRTQANILGQSAGAISSYKNKTRNPVKQDKCNYCGNAGHGKNDGPGRITTQLRRDKCPAFEVQCNNCSRKGHYAKVCRQEKKTNDISHQGAVYDESIGSVYSEMCSASNVETHDSSYEVGLVSLNRSEGQSITIDTQQHDRIRGWTSKHTDGHPNVSLQARIDPSDYAHFGYRFTTPPRCCSVKVVTDTGCQSTIIGLQTVYSMGFKKSDLIPTKIRMRAIDQNPIDIVGALLLRLSGRGQDGRMLETAQVCYVSDRIKQLFLSEQGCKQLGIIPESFPAVGAALQDPGASAVESNMNNSAAHTCDCPKRTLPPPLTTKIPYTPVESNRDILENWIKTRYKSSSFNTCPHQPLPLMEGRPVELMITPNAPPTVHHNPIPVALHWQEGVQADLLRDVALGVIEPVPVGTPVTWCHQMVIARKKDGSPRRTVDFQGLNKYCIRETHHTMSPFHQATLVPSDTKKTVFDAWNGYHSVPIRREDRHYTTFITPWGRFRYCTLPQGFAAAGDGYTRRFDEIVSDVPDKTKCIDDTCMWKPDIEQSFFQACDWLDMCGRHGIIQNPNKFQFAQDTVEFAGFVISRDGIRPGEKFIRAIRDFPTPKNTTDIRSFFGLVNQVNYCLSSSEAMRPFRDLLSPSTKFVWNDSMHTLFDQAKNSIILAITEGVRIFDKSRITCLSTDWSKQGLGFSLGQKHCTCTTDEPFCCPGGWQLTFASNRFTHNAEARYAPIEGEALAVAWALDKSRHFVLGCKDLTVATDHQPLLKILGDRHLRDIKNPRLFSLKEKTLPFLFKIIHVPGRRHFTADGISRYPSGDEHPEIFLEDDIHISAASSREDFDVSRLAAATTIFEEETNCSAVAAASFEEELTVSAMSTLASLDVVSWHDVQESTTADPTMLMLSNTILTGFPEQKQDIPEQLRSYFTFRENLSVQDGVVMYKDRIVIPPSLREQILDTLHSAHQGVTSMTSRAQASIFWPGITADLEFSRESCSPCDRMAPSQPNPPPTPSQDPIYPFQQLCADYFSYAGHNYLVVVDRYSGWPTVYKLSGGSTPLVKKLREIFVTFGIPEELATDGGPELIASETQSFLTSWGVSHRLSSVAYPHSNCRAEVAVKTVKRMITDNTDSNGDIDIPKFQRAILHYRNTPSSLDKRSPAEIVFGRQIRDFIPVEPGKYIPCHTWSSTAKNRETALMQRHAKEIELLSEHTKKLPALKVGDHVRLQNQTGTAPRKWDRTGDVVEVRQHDQYAIKVHGSGRVTLRNRKFLRKYVPFVTPTPPASILRDLVYLRPTSIAQMDVSDESMETAIPSTLSTPLTQVTTTTSPSEPTTNDVHETGEEQYTDSPPIPTPPIPSTPPANRTSPMVRPRRNAKTPSRFEDYVMSK